MDRLPDTFHLTGSMLRHISSLLKADQPKKSFGYTV